MGYFVYELRQTKFVCIDHLDFEIWQKRFFFFDEYVEDFFLSEETKLSKMLVNSRLRRVIFDTFLSELMT